MAENQTQHEHLPGGTRVLNTGDGETGVIINGYAFDADQGGWTEYEVETKHGIEHWRRGEFILFSEFEEENPRGKGA